MLFRSGHGVNSFAAHLGRLQKDVQKKVDAPKSFWDKGRNKGD